MAFEANSAKNSAATEALRVFGENRVNIVAPIFESLAINSGRLNKIVDLEISPRSFSFNSGGCGSNETDPICYWESESMIRFNNPKALDKEEFCKLISEDEWMEVNECEDQMRGRRTIGFDKERGEVRFFTPEEGEKRIPFDEFWKAYSESFDELKAKEVEKGENLWRQSGMMMVLVGVGTLLGVFKVASWSMGRKTEEMNKKEAGRSKIDMNSAEVHNKVMKGLKKASSEDIERRVKKIVYK